MSTSNSPDILTVSGLTKEFGEVVAVRNVSETFRKGEFICILGPSGCGKSTFLRLIAGFEKPDAGEILLQGKSLKNVEPERRNVNTVFQSYALFPHLTVYNNVAFGLKMKKTPADEIRRRAGEALELVGLAKEGDRYPRQLSGGQQQRVALARAIVNRPAILLLDEPLAALDKNLRLAMQDELRKIQREVGITFLHVTHDQTEALVMSDRLGVMNEGVFEQVGPPQEVYNRPVNRFVAEFLGFSNILEATAVGRASLRIMVNHSLTLQVAENNFPRNREKVTYLVRPEKIALHRHRPQHDTNVFEGVLTRLRYAGPELECDVQIGETKLLAQAIGRGEPESLLEGERVYVHIDPADIVYLPGRELTGADGRGS